VRHLHCVAFLHKCTVAESRLRWGDKDDQETTRDVPFYTSSLGPRPRTLSIASHPMGAQPVPKAKKESAKSPDALGQSFEWSAAAEDAPRSSPKSPEDEFVLVRVHQHD